jgi:hypothetical protein
MRKMAFASISLSAVCLVSPSVVHAQGMAQSDNQREYAIYGAGGAATTKSVVGTSQTTPFAVGFLYTRADGKIDLGFDVAAEGTKLDSTYGRVNKVAQAISINGLIGTRVAGKGAMRLDVAGLIGARQKSQSCPASYLGYQCYADQKPDVIYTLNYGAVVTLGYHRLLVGARITGESTQAMLGIRF